MADLPNGNQDSSRTAIMLGVRAINGLNETLKAVFPSQGATASSATGGAATLPGNPVGFLSITLPDGTLALLPYYSP